MGEHETQDMGSTCVELAPLRGLRRGEPFVSPLAADQLYVVARAAVCVQDACVSPPALVPWVCEPEPEGGAAGPPLIDPKETYCTSEPSGRGRWLRLWVMCPEGPSRRTRCLADYRGPAESAWLEYHHRGQGAFFTRVHLPTAAGRFPSLRARLFVTVHEGAEPSGLGWETETETGSQRWFASAARCTCGASPAELACLARSTLAYTLADAATDWQAEARCWAQAGGTASGPVPPPAPETERGFRESACAAARRLVREARRWPLPAAVHPPEAPPTRGRLVLEPGAPYAVSVCGWPAGEAMPAETHVRAWLACGWALSKNARCTTTRRSGTVRVVCQGADPAPAGLVAQVRFNHAPPRERVGLHNMPLVLTVHRGSPPAETDRVPCLCTAQAADLDSVVAVTSLLSVPHQGEAPYRRLARVTSQWVFGMGWELRCHRPPPPARLPAPSRRPLHAAPPAPQASQLGDLLDMEGAPAALRPLLRALPNAPVVATREEAAFLVERGAPRRAIVLVDVALLPMRHGRLDVLEDPALSAVVPHATGFVDYAANLVALRGGGYALRCWLHRALGRALVFNTELNARLFTAQTEHQPWLTRHVRLVALRVRVSAPPKYVSREPLPADSLPPSKRRRLLDGSSASPPASPVH